MCLFTTTTKLTNNFSNITTRREAARGRVTGPVHQGDNMHIAPSAHATAIDEALPRIKASISSTGFNSVLTKIITSYTPDGPELRKSVADAVCSLADNYTTIIDDSLQSFSAPVDPNADYFPELHDLVYTLARYAVDQVLAEVAG